MRGRLFSASASRSLFVKDAETRLFISAAAAFVKVAEAAITTFSEVRDDKKGWGQFGAIVVVGVVLLVAVIWLLGKSASIIL